MVEGDAKLYVFSAFDHLTYKKLIAKHVADILTLPKDILHNFKNGCFSVSLTGQPWHSVGINEAHKIGINKDCKMSIIRPSPDYINQIANYIPYRVKCLHNLNTQLFPEEHKVNPKNISILSPTSTAQKFATNIKEQKKSS